MLEIIGGGGEGRWSGENDIGVAERGGTEYFPNAGKQGDKDNMSGGEVLRASISKEPSAGGKLQQKKLQLTLVATSEKENCLYHSTYIF